MPILKKVLRYNIYTALGLLAFIALYLLLAWGLSSITVDAESNERVDVEIFILSNGVHTDIVVPVRNAQKDWSKEVKFNYTNSQDSSAKYLAFGWGDKGFYLETPTWADLKVSTAFKAVSGLGNTAIHSTFYKSLKEGEQCRSIHISQDQYNKLIQFIENSFQKDEEGHFMHIKTKANYGPSDAFYEAVGSYSLIHTCNTWANNALKSCGQKACLWTPFDKGIFSKYE